MDYIPMLLNQKWKRKKRKKNNMNLVDKKQQSTINMILIAVGVLTAITGILAYRENKKHNKIAEENLKVEKELKELELALKKDQVRKSGLI